MAKYGLIGVIISIVLFIISVMVWVKNKNAVDMLEDPATFTSPRKREALYSETKSARDLALWVWLVPVIIAIIGFLVAMGHQKTAPSYPEVRGPRGGVYAEEF